MKKLSVIALALMATISLFAQKADYNVVPMPQSVTLTNKAAFTLNANTRVIFVEGVDEMEQNARFVQEYVKKNVGLKLCLSTNLAKAPANAIKLVLDEKIANDEGYEMTIDNKGITIKGKTPAGVFYGIQTLRKSLPTVAA